MIARMARSRWYRLLVVLLLGLTLGWPLLGSLPSVAGASAHAAGPASDGCDDGCGGCDGGSAGKTCPTAMCPVIQAIVPTLDLDPPRTCASRAINATARRHGRVPDIETPPPRALRLA
jgi:hypothetical protein